MKNREEMGKTREGMERAIAAGMGVGMREGAMGAGMGRMGAMGAGMGAGTGGMGEGLGQGLGQGLSREEMEEQMFKTKQERMREILKSGSEMMAPGEMRKGGAVKKMKKGGMVKSSASKRADGIAVKGKTRGRMV